VSKKKRSKNKVEVIGKTEDWRIVVQGLFALVDTYGILLEVVIQTIAKRNLMPDWIFSMRRQ